MIPLDLPAPSADALAHSERLQHAIRAGIAAAGGAIPFSRYMELALYAPGLGYYSAGATKFGEAGDFVTAPELGPLYARTIAQAAAPVLHALGDGARWLELGGGSGAFAAAALPRLAELGALPQRYMILEPSADLRERQRERLRAELDAAMFARVDWLDGLPGEDWTGVLFANEVLDALPITRFAIRGDEVFEEYVATAADGTLGIVDLPADGMLTAAVLRLQRDLGTPFADGYRSEVLVQLPWWLQAVGGSLARGIMLFVDYGYPRREFYLPARTDGTLVCHYRHRAHDAPLHLPGLTDITAFIDFTAVAEAGEAAGFELAGYSSQALFLLGNGIERAVAPAGDDPRAQRQSNEELRRLVLPGEMGERFKVIALQRGIDAEALFAFGDQSDRL